MTACVVFLGSRVVQYIIDLKVAEFGFLVKFLSSLMFIDVCVLIYPLFVLQTILSGSYTLGFTTL